MPPPGRLSSVRPGRSNEVLERLGLGLRTEVLSLMLAGLGRVVGRARGMSI